MTPPFPPLPVGAPEIVQEWYAMACQKWEREQIAKNILNTLPPEVDAAGRVYHEREYAFAQHATETVSQLYIDALEDAGYSAADAA